jgi:hypothetical protein
MKKFSTLLLAILAICFTLSSSASADSMLSPSISAFAKAAEQDAMTKSKLDKSNYSTSCTVCTSALWTDQGDNDTYGVSYCKVSSNDPIDGKKQYVRATRWAITGQNADTMYWEVEVDPSTIHVNKKKGLTTDFGISCKPQKSGHNFGFAASGSTAYDDGTESSYESTGRHTAVIASGFAHQISGQSDEYMETYSSSSESKGEIGPKG